MSAIREEEEFSCVRMHGTNQNLLAEVLEKDKDALRGGGAIERSTCSYVVVTDRRDLYMYIQCSTHHTLCMYTAHTQQEGREIGEGEIHV